MKVIDPLPEYKAIFGSRFNRFKTAYHVKFYLHTTDEESEQPDHEKAGVLELCFKSGGKVDQPALALQQCRRSHDNVLFRWKRETLFDDACCFQSRGVLVKIKIAIGADHHGFHYKELLMSEKSLFAATGKIITWLDCGALSDTPSDFPVPTYAVCERIITHKSAERGILICSSGIGMAIAANRWSGIYAGVAWNDEITRTMREHNNCNVLVLPAD